jgi:putative transposase
MVRRRKGRTTIRVPGIATAPDLVRRDVAPTAPNRLWVADLTEVSTWEGKLYLAVMLDCCSRRCVGCAMAEHMRAELGGERPAAHARRPDRGEPPPASAPSRRSRRPACRPDRPRRRLTTVGGRAPRALRRGDAFHGSARRPRSPAGLEPARAVTAELRKTIARVAAAAAGAARSSC